MGNPGFGAGCPLCKVNEMPLRPGRWLACKTPPEPQPGTFPDSSGCLPRGDPIPSPPCPKPWTFTSARGGEAGFPGFQLRLGAPKQDHPLGDVSAIESALFSQNQTDKMFLFTSDSTFPETRSFFDLKEAFGQRAQKPGSCGVEESGGLRRPVSHNRGWCPRKAL